jgi:hypothetical protein
MGEILCTVQNSGTFPIHCIHEVLTFLSDTDIQYLVDNTIFFLISGFLLWEGKYHS